MVTGQVFVNSLCILEEVLTDVEKVLVVFSEEEEKRQLASEEKKRDTRRRGKENEIKKRRNVIKWLNGHVVCRSGNRSGHGSDREKQNL